MSVSGVPVDVSDGCVDGDAGPPIIGPQHVRREHVVVVHHRLDVSLPRVNRLGAFVSQDLNILRQSVRTPALLCQLCVSTSVPVAKAH